MPRRPANGNLRRVAESGLSDSLISVVSPGKPRRSPLVSVCLVLLVRFLKLQMYCIMVHVN